MMDRIKIHGDFVTPAKVYGSPDVFISPQFSLIKADWEPDESKDRCDLCDTKFTQLKRRHHCRMCGRLRCAKCCNEKIPLPQLELEEAERVCDSCRAIALLIVKSRSKSTAVLKESANGLSLFANNQDHLKKLLELGGLQTLVCLSLTDNLSVLGPVVSGLHALCRHPALHPWLADSGGIKALCKILSTVKEQDQQIVLDGIGALMIFCKTKEYKTKVLDDGGLSPVLDLCYSADEAVCLLAANTLGHMAEHPGNQEAIFEDKRNALSRLFQLAQNEDEQIVEVALRTLAFLSMGEKSHRQKMIQEDFSNDRPLLKVLKSSPNNPQILCNAACLVANLAVCEESQAGLRDYVVCAREKLSTADSNTEFLYHLTRALANFAQHKQHSEIVLCAIPAVVQHSLKSPSEPTRLQSLRLILSLLACQPQRVAAALSKDGSGPFLTLLGKTESLVNNIRTSIRNEAPDTVKPL